MKYLRERIYFDPGMLEKEEQIVIDYKILYPENPRGKKNLAR